MAEDSHDAKFSRETRNIASPYSIGDNSKFKAYDQQVLTYHQFTSEKEREVLQALPIKTEWTEATFLDKIGARVVEGTNDVTEYLHKAIGLADYSVTTLQIENEKHYLIRRAPTDNLSGMLCVIQPIEYLPGYVENSESDNWRHFTIHHQIYFNDKTEETIDFVDLYRTHDTKAYISFNPDRESEDFSGVHTLDRLIFHFAEPKSLNEFGYVGLHEFAHELQQYPLSSETPTTVERLFDLLLTASRGNGKILDKIAKQSSNYRKRRVAVRKSFEERNADAFSFTLLRILRDRGIRVSTPQTLNKIRCERKVSRTTDYLPK